MSATGQLDAARLRGLKCGLNALGDRADDVLALHPNPNVRKALANDHSHDELDDVIWDDLSQQLDRPMRGPQRSAVEYYRLRRKHTWKAEWQWLLGEVPDLWRRLLDLSAGDVERFAHLLGIEIVAHIVRGQQAEQLPPLLTVLDEEQMYQTMNRAYAIEHVFVPEDVLDVWRLVYLQASGKRRGRKLLRWLALSLLSNVIFLRLDHSLRTLAARHCMSSLIDVLLRNRRTGLLEKEHVDVVEHMIVTVVMQLTGDTSGVVDERDQVDEE